MFRFFYSKKADSKKFNFRKRQKLNQKNENGLKQNLNLFCIEIIRARKIAFNKNED